MKDPVENWASTLLDVTTDVITIFDKDGRYAFINRAGRQLFAQHGIDADRFVGSGGE